MKVYRTPVAYRRRPKFHYDFAIEGQEVCCIRGLKNAGWELPKRGQGLVLCFSKTKPRGNFSKARYFVGHEFLGNGLRIQMENLQGQPDFVNPQLPRYVERFLRDADLDPAEGKTRILFWWPEYVTR